MLSEVHFFLKIDIDFHLLSNRVTTIRNNEAEKGVPLEYLEAVQIQTF